MRISPAIMLMLLNKLDLLSTEGIAFHDNIMETTRYTVYENYCTGDEERVP